jgi:hypothetical protein
MEGLPDQAECEPGHGERRGLVGEAGLEGVGVARKYLVRAVSLRLLITRQ